MKLDKKIDLILWATIWMMPFIGYAIVFYRSGMTEPVFEWIADYFSFEYIKNIIDTIWNAAFDGSTLVLSGYISYLVTVEIAHCMFDALIFIPRFAHNVIERFTNFATGRKGHEK